MEEYGTITKEFYTTHTIDETEEYQEENVDEKIEYEEENELLPKEKEFNQINKLYDECLAYLKQEKVNNFKTADSIDPDYESIEENNNGENDFVENIENKMVYKIENELKSSESISSIPSEPRSERLRKLSQQLPRIIITQSNTSLNRRRSNDDLNNHFKPIVKKSEHKSLPKIDNKSINIYEFQQNNKKFHSDYLQVSKEPNNLNTVENNHRHGSTEKKIGREKQKSNISVSSKPPPPCRPGQSDFPKRLVSKRGIENVALISNVPFERIRLLNDTFHTLINLRWRWIVTGTIVVHFAIWLVFAVFWYIAALAHYDFEPNPPQRTCVTGGHDFLTIFLASVEAQTTIGFGDRAIDEECPESIFLFIMQLILGTGLSGVLTCVVYAKLTRPEKLSRDGVGFSKNAVISTRDGRLCLMMRAWDLNYDHIISSEFSAHFVHTHRSKEGEVIRYFAQTLTLQQRQFLLWPVTLLHIIDHTSPLYQYGPETIANDSYEITLSLKGASASMGTFTQSQTSYLPKEVVWGHRFPPVVKYNCRKQKYVIDHTKLDLIEPVDTPLCSAAELVNSSISIKSSKKNTNPPQCPGTPSSFTERMTSFHLERSSSFRKNASKPS